MIFLASTIISFLLTLYFGLRKSYAKINTPKYVTRSLIVGAVLIPVAGGAQGTFYSHGFDIPWWLFGIMNFCVIALTVLLVIILFKTESYWNKT